MRENGTRARGGGRGADVINGWLIKHLLNTSRKAQFRHRSLLSETARPRRALAGPVPLGVLCVVRRRIVALGRGVEARHQLAAAALGNRQFDPLFF